MNTLSFRTESTSKEAAVMQRKWWIVDADGEVVGRLCSKIAHILRGKHKPNFTPHTDCGDFVIVINAEKVRFTGKKSKQKEYLTYSLYPGGQKRMTPDEALQKKPFYIIEHSVKGMLPKTTLGKAMASKLFIYEGGEHPHGAQKPEPLSI